MSNLIITVITIAMTLAAGVMGIYYGGSYVLNGTPRTMAMGLMNSGLQVSNALKHYVNDHGYQVPNTWASMISNGYLTAIPRAPNLTTNAAGTNISEDGSGTYWLWVDLGVSTANMTGQSAAVCLAVLKNALGAQPAGIVTTGVNHAAFTGGSAAGTGNGTYGCIIDNNADNDPGALNVMTDNQGAIPTGDYAFFYRVYN